ncbi:hypothetical protein LMG24235_08249 [Paraburkholderia sabiae]|nr:hypothetical protein LMG24235_08249 [Paraburkholderia sabiae]
MQLVARFGQARRSAVGQANGMGRNRGCQACDATMCVVVRMVRHDAGEGYHGVMASDETKVLKRVAGSALHDGSTYLAQARRPAASSRYPYSVERSRLLCQGRRCHWMYLNPPLHAAVFSVDEKTAIQVLDRKDRMFPLPLGCAEIHGFEYKRNVIAHALITATLNNQRRSNGLLKKCAARSAKNPPRYYETAFTADSRTESGAGSQDGTQ